MGNWRHLGADDLRRLGDQQALTIVDIRDPVSFAAGHVEGAIALNQGNMAEFLTTADRDLPLVVCCYHGHASQNVADFMARQGFAEVYSLDGGYAGWAQNE